MARTATPIKLSANLKVNVKSTTADQTTITDITFPDITAGSNLWLDMRDYETVMFIIVCKLLTDDIEHVKVLANSSATGGDTDYEVFDSTDPLSGYDAVNDYYVVEVTAEQLNGNRYCTVAVEGGNSGDDFTVIAIRGGARFARSGLTANYQS